jgi:hypothetical protein
MSNWEQYREQSRADKVTAAEQRRADRATAAQIQLAGQSAAAEQRRADAVAAEQRAALRRAEQREIANQNKIKREAARKAFVAALPERLVALLGYALIALPVTLAWTAQADWAASALNLKGWYAQLFPASIETGAWWCLLLAEIRTRKGLPVGSLVLWAWVLAGVASVINASHGFADGGFAPALALAVLSVLGVALHSIARRLRSADHSGGLGEIRRQMWRRIRYPRLSLAAASIRAARHVAPAESWRLAWMDRFGVGPDSTRAERRIAKVITTRQAKADQEAAAKGEITLVGDHVQRGWSTEVREHIDAERQAALAEADVLAEQARNVVAEAEAAVMAAGAVFGAEALRSIPEQDRTEHPIEQREHNDQADDEGDVTEPGLSPRATTLLPELEAAILLGKVSSSPSVRAIQRWVQAERSETVGMPVAIELREAVKGRELGLIVDGDLDDGEDQDEAIAS